MSLYECEDEWMVQLETRCRHLGADRRCGIYETRPHVCRDYSEKECEVNSEDDGRSFYTPEEFLAHMEKTRPKIFAKLAAGYIPKATRASEKSAPRRLPLFEQRFRELRALGDA